MGAIADVFRSRPDVLLGKGLHRVCAWGRDAQAHSAGYARLIEVDGYALMLGVGFGCCSSMHQGEVVSLPAEITQCFRLPDYLRSRYAKDLTVSYGSTSRDA